MKIRAYKIIGFDFPKLQNFEIAEVRGFDVSAQSLDGTLRQMNYLVIGQMFARPQQFLLKSISIAEIWVFFLTK